MTLVCVLALLLPSIHALRPYRLRVEYNQNPIGLDVDNPRFSWALDNEGVRGDDQSAYRLIVSNTETGDIVADSQKVQSSDSSHIVLSNFSVLTSPSALYSFSVQTWNASDAASPAETGHFQNGLASQTAWQDASWLCIPAALNPNRSNGLIMNQFRTQFEIASSSPIAKALCYIASPNYYVAFINGVRCDEHVLGAFSQFEYTAYYDTMSCAHLLSLGSNVLGISLGNGRYSESNIDMGPPMVKVMVDVSFANGHTMRLRSNSESWQQGYGPIRMNDIYVGEWYDATHETKGWLHVGFDHSGWIAANIVADPVLGQLKSASVMPVIRKMQSFGAMSVNSPVKNVYVFDFGQNVAGMAQLRVPGNAYRGRNLTMIHSEQLNEMGTVDQIYGKGKELAVYTLRGDGNEELYTPSFTNFGYQYIQLHVPAEVELVPSKDMLTSYLIHTAFDDVGSIEFGPASSSNAQLLNSIESMTRYSSKSNYMNIPTDCPQRERYGYLGDAQLTSNTVLFHWDIAASYTKFLGDIRDAQMAANAKQSVYVDALPDSAPYFFSGGGQFPGLNLQRVLMKI